jgi:hypothetical protein
MAQPTLSSCVRKCYRIKPSLMGTNCWKIWISDNKSRVCPVALSKAEAARSFAWTNRL